MQLSWTQGFSLARKPTRKRRPRRKHGDSTRPFLFVEEDPSARRSSISSPPTPTAYSYQQDKPPSISDQIRGTEPETVEPSSCSKSPSPAGCNSMALTRAGMRLQNSWPRSPLEIAADLDASRLLDRFKPALRAVLYHDLSERYGPVLERYDQEFCRIPLTIDTLINPFRCRTGLDESAVYLAHAVMALTGHHVKSPSFLAHRHHAVHLLRERVGNYNKATDVVAMLDTIMILFTLDETQSIFGNWGVHLAGAFCLIEASGGMPRWSTSPRVLTQIGLLIWWDAIVALIAREDCVFPFEYFDAVVSNHDSQLWDYYSICGCPQALVEVVMQLARLAAEKHKSSSTGQAHFDISLVDDIEAKLISWQHMPTATAYEDEESMQQDQDRMHCSEAWRNGLHLYVFRVFRWRWGDELPMPVLLRARAVLDHVFACRDEIRVAKQTLLPLFFAGCELRDPLSRKRIIQSCCFWNDHTRYFMFNASVPLLEEIWAEQAERGFANVWWGQIVDRRHSHSDGEPLQRRISFA